MKNELTPQIAAMYLGQKCEYKSKEHPLQHGVITPLVIDLMQDGRIKVTPHIRPLSSLTEAEAMKIYEIYFETPKPDHFKKTGKEWFKAAFFDNQMYPAFPAHIFTYLLSLGFDLFQGIEAGWAKEIK